MVDLTGKVALITGAGQGVGQGIALAMAAAIAGKACLGCATRRGCRIAAFRSRSCRCGCSIWSGATARPRRIRAIRSLPILIPASQTCRLARLFAQAQVCCGCPRCQILAASNGKHATARQRCAGSKASQSCACAACFARWRKTAKSGWATACRCCADHMPSSCCRVARRQSVHFATIRSIHPAQAARFSARAWVLIRVSPR